MTVMEIYRASNGAATKALYADLQAMRGLGPVAMNLFRAQKCSERAKKYRGGIPGKGSYRDMAYERKNWSLEQLCAALKTSSLQWGWKKDPAQPFHSWVLYVDLPTGQVSFHSRDRYAGPDYPGDWDGIRGISPQRIILFCQRVLDSRGVYRADPLDLQEVM